MSLLHLRGKFTSRTSARGHHAEDDNHVRSVGCVLYQMPGRESFSSLQITLAALDRRGMVGWSVGRPIVSGMHRLIGQGGRRPRVGGVFGRLTALPPPTPPQLSCLIRIRGIHKSCLHMRGRGSKSGHKDGRSGRSHWLYTANQSLKRGLEGWVQNP